MNTDNIVTFSFTKGICFNFNHAGYNIKAGGSTFSRKEWVTANGKLVSEKRSLKTKSIHVIYLGDEQYKIVFSINIFKGSL